LRALESTDTTRTSTLSPTPKRSGRCSERSRERSERRMNERIPSYSTSMPPSSILVTWTVMTEPRFTPPMASANGSPSMALIESEMRSFSTSTSVTLAVTVSPLRKSAMASSPGPPR
jgi:hypothetical protein